MEAEIIGAKEALGEKQANLISYKWGISGGHIISGRATPRVTIGTESVPSRDRLLNVDVTLKIFGLPPTLEKERTCLIKIDPKCNRPQLFARYDDITLTKENLVLDRLAKDLVSSHLRSVAYFVVYAGQSACFGEAEWRADRAQRYLIKTHKISADRIVAVDGGFRETLTVEIFTSPVDSCGPLPAPTRLPTGLVVFAKTNIAAMTSKGHPGEYGASSALAMPSLSSAVSLAG